MESIPKISFQAIPEKYEILLNLLRQNQIKFYSMFSFFHIQYMSMKKNYDKKEFDGIFEDYLYNYLTKYKFMTYNIFNGNDNISNTNFNPLFKDNCKNIQNNSIEDSVNVVICVEEKCLIIEEAPSVIIRKVINKLIDYKLSLINTEISNRKDSIEKEIMNFVAKFSNKIKNNNFACNTILPIAGYLIRRFFYPTDYFQNPQFFDFDKSEKVKENEIKKQIKAFTDANEFDPMKLKYIKDQIDSNISSKHYQDFVEEDFIILSDPRSSTNRNFVFYFVMHIQSFHVFMMKKIINYENFDDLHETKFCTMYSHRCFTPFYGFLFDKKGRKIGFIYKYMVNQSLKSYVSSLKDDVNQLFSLMTIIRIFKGIEYLQSQSLLHRDLKPSNILLDNDFLPYIADYDTVCDENKDEYTYNFSSPLYSSPEQSCGMKEISFPTDIYSFGLIIYFLFEKKDMLSKNQNSIFNIDLYKVHPISNCSENMQELYKSCVEYLQEKRLKSHEIKSFLINEIKTFPYESLMKETSQFIHFIYEFFYVQEKPKSSNIPEWYLNPFTCPNSLVIRPNNFTLSKNRLHIEGFRSLIEKNDPDTLLYLAGEYERGVILDQDYSKSKEYYEILAKQNHPTALLKLGLYYGKGYGVKQDYFKAKEYYEKLAELQNPNAYYNLGILYLNGKGTDKNYSKAMEYFELAAKQKHSGALLNIGFLYFNGYGVKQDILKAKEYFEQSAYYNDPSAFYNLGILYMKGLGVQQDHLKALKYFEISANGHNLDACFILGNIYWIGLGVEKNCKKAIEYYKRAANPNHSIAFIDFGYHFENEIYDKNGNSNAQLELGIIYLEGKEVGEDVMKSREYFELAAKQNNVTALLNLGNIFYQGIGFKKDYWKAKKYFELAANTDNSMAYVLLGDLYKDGYEDIVKKDYLKAKECYELAAQKNNSEALHKLGVLYYSGQGVEKNDLKAKEYFESSAWQSNSEANRILGIFYKNGIGGEKSLEKSKEKLVLSAQQNNPESMYILAQYLSNDFDFEVDLNEAIQYYQKCISFLNNEEVEYIYMDNNYLRKSIHNDYFYQSHNDLALIYLIVLNDIKKAEEYMKKAAFAEYPFAQCNYGVMNQFVFQNKNFSLAKHMYERSSSHNFALADYNLGYFLEKNGEKEESIKYYIKSSDEEHMPMIYHNKICTDIRHELSKFFIMRMLNLKLTKHYLIESNFDESKKYFFRSFPELNCSGIFELTSINGTFTINIKSLILDFPYFDIKKMQMCFNIQYYINSDFKIDEKNQIYILLDRIFISIIHDQSQANSFIKVIDHIINSMEKIIYKPPYQILFGRIGLGFQKADDKTRGKDINESFYESLGDIQ